MLRPGIFGEDLFDDWFAFPDFRDLDRTERKLYGRHADRMMKTDVHEHDDHYEVDIDLPGFKIALRRVSAWRKYGQPDRKRNRGKSGNYTQQS